MKTLELEQLEGMRGAAETEGARRATGVSASSGSADGTSRISVRFSWTILWAKSQRVAPFCESEKKFRNTLPPCRLAKARVA